MFNLHRLQQIETEINSLQQEATRYAALVVANVDKQDALRAEYQRLLFANSERICQTYCSTQELLPT
jgi:hypothetical protein